MSGKHLRSRFEEQGRRPVRIANCSGGRNDPGYQMLRHAERGYVDFITGDYLAEVSLAENAEAMRAEKHNGWFDTCLDGVQQSLDFLAEKHIKVIVNGGGLNPGGLARKIQQLIQEKGYGLRVAYVSGDDILEEVRSELLETKQLPPHLDGDNPDVNLNRLATAFLDTEMKPLVAANAYLGARGIVKALDAGADIIICGRVADASPVIGAAWWWFGWNDADYDRLAHALVAGHLIECSGYLTGGNFSGFDQYNDLDLFVDIPFPIAEIELDGSTIVTMDDTGKGLLNEDTVRCQFLYELQGAIYLNSDVTADLTDVTIKEVRSNRVQVRGIKGSPPPATTKFGIFYQGGYQCQLLLNATGYATNQKWDLLEKQVKYRLKRNGVLEKFDILEFQIIGTPQENPESQLASTTYCRVFAQAPDEVTCVMLRKSWAEFVMQHFSGLHYSLDFRAAMPMRYIAYYPALYPQHRLQESAHILQVDGTTEKCLNAGHPPNFQDPPCKRISFDAEPLPTRTGPTKRVRIGDITLGRSGDKGANLNFGIIPKDSSHWPWLRSFFSRAKLRELIGKDWKDEYFIERIEFPNIQAVHFVIYGILGRGSSSSVILDALGKGFCDYIRDKVIDVPVDIFGHGE
ncbi:hypothetical protein AJ80_03339 [Polytolypa hystricis UAMH7299]|uniref:DUF1446 domain-containing protein n=1 Tax=Polytolypa hystricis (strain UAMH7299) TaxID=1447883 RepID=A0A2B7YJQ6_POLH7|nr:hypothetical protein AJ80_03339 [Polytolypa hystricis UAMH7299]